MVVFSHFLTYCSVIFASIYIVSYIAYVRSLGADNNVRISSIFIFPLFLQ